MDEASLLRWKLRRRYRRLFRRMSTGKPRRSVDVVVVSHVDDCCRSVSIWICVQSDDGGVVVVVGAVVAAFCGAATRECVCLFVSRSGWCRRYFGFSSKSGRARSLGRF